VRVELDHYQPLEAADKGLGSFLKDIVAAMDEARSRGDEFGVHRLWHLWLVYLVDTLSKMPAEQLREYIESRGVWQTHEDVAVFRTASTPCVAFTAIEFRENDVLRLYAMGARYELSDPLGQTWWREIIQPRTNELTAGL
jgi:hypothetical protein